jgi:hypothetical protein
MKSCVQLYLDLAPGLELDRVSTPFLDEDGRDAPSRSAAHVGPLEECPWCAHTFPPNPWPDLRAMEASKRATRAISAAGGNIVASDIGSPRADNNGTSRWATSAAGGVWRRKRRRSPTERGRGQGKVGPSGCPDLNEDPVRCTQFAARHLEGSHSLGVLLGEVDVPMRPTAPSSGLLHTLHLQLSFGGLDWGHAKCVATTFICGC